MNEIFLCRVSDNRISSQRAFVFDLKALDSWSRVIAER
jgi:ketosteroid isomerase-like protein